MPVNDDRQIKERDPRKLTIEDIRALVRYCDCQSENLWRPVSGDLTVAGILYLYHAAFDAGIDGAEAWWWEEPEAARAAYEIARGLGR